jgi:tetratricopeptide (TPR) repeat protein
MAHPIRRLASLLTFVIAIVGLVFVATALLSSAGATRAVPGTPVPGQVPTAVPPLAGARAWQGEVGIPSYPDGPPDPNAPFDLFQIGRPNYPYTLRTNLTATRVDKVWRALWLENEYLKCLILPDLGGHLYSCTDKRNGRQLFYANPSIKFAAIAYRGAWAALGIEFNFPVSHNWMTTSPVDFATTARPDGSASVWIGNIDRPYGMQWRVELTLRPGRAVLEQTTTLYNRADVRHRFYWWTNAGVEVQDDSEILYPMEYSASHGFTFVDTWPIDSAGHDLSVVGNHKYGPVSRFALGSREPYMGVYHPKTQSGIVHYSAPTDLPAKKLWSWSSDADGLDWRRALSDNNSAYVEIQAGLFRNQETYGFLEPQQSVQFSESWMPMWELGGLSRATPDMLLNLTRTAERPGIVTLDVALNALGAFPGATLAVFDGHRSIARETLDLSPTAAIQRHYPGQLSAGAYTVRVTDRGGRVLLAHTEGVYDYAGRMGAQSGPQPETHPPARKTDADFEAEGRDQELNGQRLPALVTYREGLKRFPESESLNRATGRLLVDLKQPAEAIPLLTKVLSRVSNDRETAYYFGLAQRSVSAIGARLAFESAEQYGPHRTAALFQLAALAARDGDRIEAGRLLGEAVAESPLAIRAGGMSVALSRVAGRIAEARQRLEDWRRLDPTSSLLRFEAVKLGGDDPALWAHLAADPERILELVVDYQRFGLLDDALDLLTRAYPSGPAVVSEPGMSAPASYPLIAYYRGYLRSLCHQSPLADYAAASAMPTTYVFPNRPESLAVLKDAVARDPQDATAHFLIGSLYLSGGMVDLAMTSWEAARLLKPGIPTLHRNMGYTFLERGELDKAIATFREGTKYDPANVGVYTGLELALSRAGRPAAERADALLSYPDQKVLPASLVFELATALADAGRFDGAERQFVGRFFPREEGGINVRQVWVDVRLKRALALAKTGDCRGASVITGGIDRPVPGLAFTRDGLEPIIARTASQQTLEAIRTTCGEMAMVQDADVPYGIGAWDADTYGNHRAIVRVSAAAPAVRVHIPWRRWDAHPEQRNVLVVRAATDERVLNVVRLAVTREAGDLVFEAPAAGDYFVYYLPYTGGGRANYPKVTYPEPEATADAGWVAQHHLRDADLALGAWRELTEATVVEFQSVDQLNDFFPMLVIATPEETSGLVARFPQSSYLVFPEDRTHPIKMPADLPLRWVRRGANGPLRAEAQRGEYYAFQLGVYAARQALEGLHVTFGALSRKGGGSIPARAQRCFNLGGTDSAALAFTKTVGVEQGHVQALWCGIDVPERTPAGTYTGALVVAPRGATKTTIPVQLRVLPAVIAAHGDNEPWRLSRLRWLDSTLAVDDGLVPPYTPVTVIGQKVGILGRTVTLDAKGFPSGIESRFSIEMTHLAETGRQVLTGPVALVASGSDPGIAPWKGSGVTFTKKQPGAAAWTATAVGGALTMATEAQLDFDGNLEYVVKVDATRPTPVDDIRLDIPVADDVARYLMGLGFKGGARPATFEWVWDVATKNQDSAWVGDVNAGLQFTLKDDKYVRPLNTNFYTMKPLVAPSSWFNGGKGGCRLAAKGGTYLVSCFSGARTVEPGAPLFFNFRLLITPFKPIDPKAQFTTRFFHAFKPPADVLETGANVVNVHHAQPINPYINYPFFRPAEMKAYIDKAHQLGERVKIYYTVRELANRAPELFALRSLGDEIFAPGPGGGFSWLQEHLGTNYIAAWFVPELKDAAVVTSGVSRWHNFYIEGLQWLTTNVGIDGLYIDDVAFDRLTMKRVRKVLDRNRPNALIDLHSANQYNPRDGFASSANLYLEHFPFLNRLWFGEYFNYDSAPDYWLTEISGIPFGLMGEMLEGGGNPWRGMVFGMTGRLPWSGDPRSMWKAWDEFGIADSRMIGFWVPASPVKTGNADILATAYVRDGRTMVALASWSSSLAQITLDIDWKALGLDPATVKITLPDIDGFQEGRVLDPTKPIPVEAGKGLVLVIQ